MTLKITEKLTRNIDRKMINNLLKKAKIESRDFGREKIERENITFGIFIPFEQMENYMREGVLEYLGNNVNHYFELTAFKEDIKKLIKKEASVKILYAFLREKNGESK
jgi:hypothetical protein